MLMGRRRLKLLILRRQILAGRGGDHADLGVYFSIVTAWSYDSRIDNYCTLALVLLCAIVLLLVYSHKAPAESLPELISVTRHMQCDVVQISIFQCKASVSNTAPVSASFEHSFPPHEHRPSPLTMETTGYCSGQPHSSRWPPRSFYATT